MLHGITLLALLVTISEGLLQYNLVDMCDLSSEIRVNSDNTHIFVLDTETELYDAISLMLHVFIETQNVMAVYITGLEWWNELKSTFIY